MDGRKILRLFQFLASLQCFQHFLISPLLPDKLSLMGKICFQLSPFPVKYGNINNIITITSLGATICTGGASLLSKESTNNSCVTLPTNIGWRSMHMNIYYFSWTFIIYFQGSYDSYECGLEISEAEAADDGEWSCDIESYVKYGKRGDGKMASVSGEENILIILLMIFSIGTIFNLKCQKKCVS